MRSISMKRYGGSSSRREARLNAIARTPLLGHYRCVGGDSLELNCRRRPRCGILRIEGKDRQFNRTLDDRKEFTEARFSAEQADTKTSRQEDGTPPTNPQSEIYNPKKVGARLCRRQPEPSAAECPILVRSMISLQGRKHCGRQLPAPPVIPGFASSACLPARAGGRTDETYDTKPARAK